MEFKGKVIQVMPMVTGEGKNGTWKKQEYVVEVPNGNYAPKKVMFSLWGDKIEQARIAQDEELEIFFDLESREYNGRWYTDVRAWKVNKLNQQHPPASSNDYQVDYSQEPVFNNNNNIEDDLPF